ncbi:mitochondrial carrier domain-containing protein [Lentinula edodes]|uniref:Mitochondrial carrier domain-containing protein n=1 Tax=Lentinula lateritia TaxID=40482 RepID=A0A9W9DFH2_9AGAR|nr:mitochondrial carrier domain-containing protein [Lentinula edodes]
MLGVGEIITLLVSLAVSFAIFVPLTGVLVRFRAQYNPRGLQLDVDGTPQPHTGPVIRSYFAMMKRVYRIEGWAGLYKGLMPTLLSTLFVTGVILTFMDTPSPSHGRYHAPNTSLLGTLFYSIIMMLISLPTSIITYRYAKFVSECGLGLIDISFRAILTPTERRKPWILYLTPGLLASEVLHIVIVVVGLGPLRRLLLPKPELGSYPDYSLTKLGIYIVVVLITTAVLSPLEVMSIRLAIQRNHASAEYNSVSQEIEGDAEDNTEFSGNEEDVITFVRLCYLGLVDCAKRMVDEEGFSSMYRAWWITLLGGLGSVASY